VGKNKSEIIAQALEAKRHASKPVSFEDDKVQTNIKIVKNIRQPTRPSIVKIRNQAISTQDALDEMMRFVNDGGNIYLTFGGVGDLVLLLADCCEDPLAKIVFFANNGSKEFGDKFLKLFGISYRIFDNIFGSGDAHRALNMLQATGRLMKSAHLPDGLDYGDWVRNTDKYLQRMPNKTNWIDKFGNDDSQMKGKKVIFAPSGSYRSLHKQKFLQPHEAEAVIKVYLKKGFTVLITGSEDDKIFYSNIRNPKVFWLTATKIIDYKNYSTSIDFNKFIQIINSADEFCSVDTWLKTYTCLIGKPTKVFDNRYNNKYTFGSDSGDFIFLNQKIWPSMKLVRVEEFIKLDGLV
jgi:hypothetical protein